MKSTTFVSTALLSLAGSAMADYGLLAIRSGSGIQYSSAYGGDDGKVYLGGDSGNALTGDFSDDKFVLSKPVGGKSLAFDSDGALVLSDDGASASNDGENHLVLDNNGGGFTACSNGAAYAVYNSQKDCENGIPFIFRLESIPSDSNSTSTTTESSETATPTEAPTETSTSSETTTTSSIPEFTGAATSVQAGSIFAIAAGVIGVAALY